MAIAGTPLTVGSEQKQAAKDKPVRSQIAFLGRAYHLASFNRKSNPMWEFASANETVNNWTLY